MDRWTSLVVQCLRPHASTAGSMDLIPGQRSSACHVAWPKKNTGKTFVVVQSCMTLSTLGFLVLHHLPELAQTHVRRVSDAIQPSHPLSFPSPALNLSQHHDLFNESTLGIRWPKNWSFSFHISPSNDYLGLISFRIDWFDLLVVQVTLNSLLKDHC